MTSKTQPLSDLHYVLLAIAIKRTNGSILSPSTSIGVTRAGLTRAINTLIKRGYVEEIATQDDSSVWRTDDERRLAAVITHAGRAAVAEADGKKGEEQQNPTVSEAVSAASEPNKPKTKQALLIDMLQRPKVRRLPSLSKPPRGFRIPLALP